MRPQTQSKAPRAEPKLTPGRKIKGDYPTAQLLKARQPIRFSSDALRVEIASHQTGLAVRFLFEPGLNSDGNL